jgi:predicted peroxiredoxin
MKPYMKYAIAIPIFAAMLVTAMTALPASKQTADAFNRPIMIHISSGNADDVYQFHSAMMGVDHALALHGAGKNVAVLLDVNGVHLAAKNPPKDLSDLNKKLKTFLDAGGRVIACEHCITMAGYDVDDMLAGVEIDKHPTMPRMQDLLDAGATVLDY